MRDVGPSVSVCGTVVPSPLRYVIVTGAAVVFGFASRMSVSKKSRCAFGERVGERVHGHRERVGDLVARRIPDRRGEDVGSGGKRDVRGRPGRRAGGRAGGRAVPAAMFVTVIDAIPSRSAAAPASARNGAVAVVAGSLVGDVMMIAGSG